MLRIRQGLWYLWPCLRDEDVRWAARVLPADLAPIFAGMGAPDRSHALRVARRVELKGGAGAILQAALLHDVGKPKEFGLFWRTWCVMVPDSVLGEATDRSSGPAWARHIHRHHEAMGRLRLLQAGASSELLELLSGKGERTALGWLREADDLG